MTKAATPRLQNQYQRIPAALKKYRMLPGGLKKPWMLCMHNKFFNYLRYPLRKRMRREETVDHNIKAAWHSIARMYNQQAMKYDATMSMGFVLLNINSDEGSPATKIAPLMGLEARSLTRLLKSMEEKKLIYREADKNDKRSVRIRLTKEGKEKKERARETVLRFNNAVREEISEDKLMVFFDVLQRINQIVERDNIYEKVHN